jgi:hypothetical protein
MLMNSDLGGLIAEGGVCKGEWCGTDGWLQPQATELDTSKATASLIYAACGNVRARQADLWRA